jgi:hypothetical protein
MEQKMELDRTSITILGFYNAGWTKHCEHWHRLGVHVYTTTTPIYNDLQKSIYGRAHDNEALISKSLNKSKSPKSVESALGKVGDLLQKIQEPDTRRAIINYILLDIQCLNDDKEVKDLVEDLIVAIEKEPNPNQAMIELAIEEIAYADKTDISADLTGYAFARALDKHINLASLFFGRDENLLKEIKSSVGYVNIETKAIDVQKTLAESKRMIVDTLQENLERLQRGENIIPIDMVVSAEATDRRSFFSPNWALVTNKVGFVLTNSEIRMIYKLMHEIDAPLINKIMKESVSFIHTTDHDFKRIPPPWESDAKAWSARVRSKDRAAHRDRTDEDIQDWVKELIALSKRTAQQLALGSIGRR